MKKAPPTSDILRVIQKLGMDIQGARQRRGITAAELADAIGVSRFTMVRVEQGNPGVKIGVYAAVLAALNLLPRLGMVADMQFDHEGLLALAKSLPSKRVSRKRKEKHRE